MEMFPSIRRHASHLTNNVKLLTVKLKVLHSGCFSSGHLKYHCYYLTRYPHVTTARFQIWQKKGHSLQCVIVTKNII